MYYKLTIHHNMFMLSTQQKLSAAEDCKMSLIKTFITFQNTKMQLREKIEQLITHDIYKF